MTSWRCIGGIDTPLRRIDGEVACAATDGKNCLWGKCRKGKLQALPTNLRPLKCGNDHKSKWGSTGYNDRNHWCSKANNILPRPRVYDWKCLGDIGSPITKIDGDIACAATDGKNCLWDRCKNGNLQGLPVDLNPLKCGQDHNSKWGSTGYNDQNHWCSKAKRILEPQPAPVPAPAPAPVPAPAPPPAPVVQAAPPPKPEPKPKPKPQGFDFYYYIDLVISIIAITIALLTTTNADWSIRTAHVVLAIMFRYLYLGYFVINNTGQVLAFIRGLWPF